ncbi:MAG: type II/IV secretion system ATPase subunit [Candidatus Altiarchaeota archaeon]|nr:type II/IV secretion system ATPase subunit [Candidatus Altiarchaeota archaeon]
MKLIGQNCCCKLVLNDGYYKKEYSGDIVHMLHELYNISETLAFNARDECGVCGRIMEDKVRRFKEIVLRDPLRVVRGNPRIERDEGVRVDGIPGQQCEECEGCIRDSISLLIERLENSQLIKKMSLLGIDDYGLVLTPLVRPFFSESSICLQVPGGFTKLASYANSGSEVTIYSNSNSDELYFIHPPEYGLSPSELKILKEVYGDLADSVPLAAGSHFETRFKEFSKQMLAKKAAKNKLSLTEERMNILAEILPRYSLGLDVIELLLRDPNLQDVYINSPVEETPIYVKHKDYDDCRTNIFLTENKTKNLVSKFRLRSGRAFSEVSPILDMELPEFGVRVNVTGPPVSPDGYAFAFRRGGERPWTLLKFIDNGMISPLAAGLLGFIVNEESTVLLCGDRGSGKTSLLTALVGAMPTKYRILTIEDTFEIPVNFLAANGFRIQRMKVKPPTNTRESFEVSTDDALRSLLRMGDSAIVMGEVRGQEARTLYEAMNVGGSGNCVLGTIHGKSPRSLLERVVSSLGVPAQSFKATDLVVLANRVRPQGGSQKFRRVTEIVEVGKSWKDPNPDDVFKRLMLYNPDTDTLEPTGFLKHPERSEVLDAIAFRRGVAASEVWRDIQTRGRVYGYVVERQKELKNRRLLEVETLVEINKAYSSLTDSAIKKGRIDFDLLFELFANWFEERFVEQDRRYRIDISTKDGIRKLHETL